jgi:integrase
MKRREIEKTETGIKEPVRLKRKKLSNGNISLYLEKYNGYEVVDKTEEGKLKMKLKREFEYLKLYLVPERTPTDKIANEQTLSLANATKAKRIVEIQNDTQGFKNTSTRKKVQLCPYIESLANDQLAKTGNKRSNYYNLLDLNRHLKLYRGDNLNFSQIDEAFVKGFIIYLQTARNLNCTKTKHVVILGQNTQNKLYNKLCYVLYQAERAGIITINPAKRIQSSDKPKALESKREYLTVEEITLLIKTDCTHPNIKAAFLFCCLTGLRYSDVKKITWGDFETDNNGGTVLKFRMQKTKGQMYLQISDEALKWLPERGTAKDADVVYTLPRNDHANEILKKWITAAKIKKTITFHSSRHTAATLNLTLGTPLEVVSKLLGHTKIATTQIYAKIVSKAQRAAVDKQNGIFG